MARQPKRRKALTSSLDSSRRGEDMKTLDYPINVRLSIGVTKYIDKTVKQGYFRSRSDMIRYLVMKSLDCKGKKKEAGKHGKQQ
jgi:hypothetical protein